MAALLIGSARTRLRRRNTAYRVQAGAISPGLEAISAWARRRAWSSSFGSSSGWDWRPVSASAREAGERARKSAALAWPPVAAAVPRMRILAALLGPIERQRRHGGWPPRSYPSYACRRWTRSPGRSASSTSLQSSTRDETRPVPSTVARVIACGPRTWPFMASLSHIWNGVTRPGRAPTGCRIPATPPGTRPARGASPGCSPALESSGRSPAQRRIKGRRRTSGRRRMKDAAELRTAQP